MDRTGFTACAAALVGLGALASHGCGYQDTRADGTRGVARPAVLADLQETSRGPARRLTYARAESSPPAEIPFVDRPIERGIGDMAGLTDDMVGAAPFETSPAEPVVRGTPQNPLRGPAAADAPSTPPPADPPTTTSPLPPTSDIAIIGPSLGGSPNNTAPAPPPAAPSALAPKTTDDDALVIETDPKVDFPAELMEDAPPRTERYQLPWANAAPRTPQMAAVVEQANRRVARGFQLAERGALYSARNEFVAALQLIAQANDMQQSTRIYSHGLSAGLAALKEGGQFVRAGAAVEGTDLARLISGHKTPLLKNTPVAELTPTAAAQRYYTYAQEQLAAAAAQEMTGSMALFGLGKLAMTTPAGKSQQLEPTAEAMALYQASLMADQRNLRAANELAVILAENGNLPRARDLLAGIASREPSVVVWRNLAVIHTRLGERQLAGIAQAQAVALERAGHSATTPPATVVDADTFVRTAPPSDAPLPPVASSQAPPATTPSAPADAKPEATTAKRGISDWLPWNLRR